MIILASASPRRMDLLRRVGLAFEARPTHVDETVPPGADAEAAALAIARRKAEAIPPAPGTWVVAADTLGALGTEIIGKPKDALDAQRILLKLQDRAHRVVTGVVVRSPDGRLHEATASTTVHFAPLSPDRIRAYVETGEPLDKACAYAIQGGGREFIVGLEGDYSNVVGLPMRTLLRLLETAGYELPPDLQVS